MTGQDNLWDFAAKSARQEETRPEKTGQEEIGDKARDEHREEADRDLSRRRSIGRLRASGHWLTLLRVARTIPQPFTLNDISVAVWHARPDVFGMRGYPHPDNHKVHYILYGSRGLIAKGIIKRVREGLFSLPDALDVEALAGPGRDSGTVSPAPEPGDSEARPEG
jgi:hypothetical protein